jgi:heme/copper-type cytochrome/quinol oxidase subunit 3
MDTSLEHTHEHTHELEPHIKVARARAGVLLFIVSDVLAVLAILAAGGYLSALNTENQYRPSGDHAPAFLPGLLIVIALVLSGLFYFLWERRSRKPGEAGLTLFFLVSLVLMLVAGVAETILAAGLKYALPIHAYESVQLLMIWYSAIHLLLAAIIGVLLGGRILRNRLAGHEFIAEVVGYWWYYTVVAGILLWLFGVILS